MRRSSIIAIILILVTAFFAVACSSNTTQSAQPQQPAEQTTDVAAPASPPNTAEPTATNAPSTPQQPTTTAPAGAAPQVHEISITAFQFGFEPSTITVRKGELVRITLTSKDVEHGISISDLKVFSKGATTGSSEVIEFTPQKTGNFPFRCDVMCGSGHRDMTGTIIVTE